MGIISVILSRLCIFSLLPLTPPPSPLSPKNYQAACIMLSSPAPLSQKIMETDCTERMCRVRLARNRESNWANEFLGRALSCNYTLTCLTILLPLNPAVVLLCLPTATTPLCVGAQQPMHRNAAAMFSPVRRNYRQFLIFYILYKKNCTRVK